MKDTLRQQSDGTAPGRNRDHAHVIAFPPLIVLGAGLVGGAIHYFIPVRIVPEPLALPLAGLLGGVAAALALWGARQLTRAGTAVNPYDTSTAVVRTGPYAFTRNPLYLSMGLVVVAVGLAFNSLPMVLAVVPFFLVIHFGVVLREERYLDAKFPEAYADYRRSVRRWL